MAKIILIVGSTGKQGQALIAALNATQKDGDDTEFHMLALTRNPAGASAAPNVTAVKGDLEKPEEIKSIFEDYKKKETPIWGVFCVLAYPGLGGSSEPETKQGKASLL
jgi:nucleoside-diphosphate-sugar epimerase